MKCVLCKKEITDYNEKFNRMKIDDSHEYDICRECVDKVVLWQGKIISELFPTKQMKKRYNK